MLPDVSDSSNSGRVSGYGVAAGYVGSLLAMVLVLPFVSGSIRAGMPAPISGDLRRDFGGSCFFECE